MTRTSALGLLAVALVAACGGSETTSPDASLADAGGTFDAALVADASLFDAPPGLDAAPGIDARAPTGDIEMDLQAIPGLTIMGETSSGDRRIFRLTYVQPVDHHDPGGPTFTQRLTLQHRGYDVPVVLYTHGYLMDPSSTGRYEPTTIVNGNQLEVEHRFFGASNPSPRDWSKLDIWQAANDHHRVVQAFKHLYPGGWLNTGHSKDGMAAVYHRRFFPDDVDGTVAYVAPLSLAGPDARYVSFVEMLGTDDCRMKLREFQIEVLGDRREAMLELMDEMRNVTFDILGPEMALEHVVLELPFGMWQYGTASLCSAIPPASETNQNLWSFLDGVGDVAAYGDTQLQRYAGYYYQALDQLGWPQINEAHVADLLEHPGTDGPAPYSPAPADYDPAVMADIDTWVRTEGRTLLFLYGGNDPWTAAAFELGAAEDSFKHIVPAGNHGAKITNLPEPERTMARETLRRWAGVGTPAKPWPEEPSITPPRRPL